MQRHRAVGILVWLAAGAIAYGAFISGLRLREWVYNLTEPIHFTSDIQRGCYWGLEASGPEGYLNQYEKMAPEQPEWRDYRWSIWLDYAPLRLLVMSRWGAWLRTHGRVEADQSAQDAWQGDYAFTAPVLHFNTAMDALGAACAFFLTRLWVRRGSAQKPPSPLRGLWQGMVAALLLWFNPAMLISAYGWPTWDAWIVPMYLLAALLASVDWWFCAGLAVAVGAMFKGQQLAVAVIFILWPFLQGKFGAGLRWCAGLVFGFAAIASPWLVSYLPPEKLADARRMQLLLPVALYPERLFEIQRVIDTPALLWIGGLLAAAGILPWLARRVAPAKASATWTDWLLQPRWQVLGLAFLGIAAAVMWPWSLGRNHAIAWQGLAAAVVLAVVALAIRPRHQPYALAAAAGGALLLCMSVFHGSSGWWDCSFHYGTIHWPWLIVGRSSNLPGLLQERFNWPAHDLTAVVFTAPAIHWLHSPEMDVSIKQLCNGVFAVLLAISGIAISLQARRRDRRMLVALVTPWVLFFCFPVQIHERYLLFAAGAAAICIGQSVGMALLGLFLTGVTAIMTLHVMLENGDRAGFGEKLAAAFPRLCSESAGDTLYKFIAGTFPDIAWGVLVVAGVFLYVSLTGWRRSRSKHHSSPPSRS